MEKSNQEILEIKKFTEKIKDCMFITVSKGIHVKARPMTTAHFDENGSIWFFTNEFTSKVKDIWKNNIVVITYTSFTGNSYIVLKGVASLTRNRNKIEQLWSHSLKVWFPAGLDDPNIILIHVDPIEAEFWSGDSRMKKIVFKSSVDLCARENYIESKSIPAKRSFLKISI